MAAVDPRSPAAPAGLPRLLTPTPGSGGPADLAAHRSLMPPPPRPRRGPDQTLIDEIERAGLLGRGGAGFPTATKLRAVASGRRRPVVVVNGAESEPASRKDRLLLTTRPHLVLDGALAAAAAVGSDRIEIGLDTDDAIGAIESALAARRGPERPGPTIHIVRVPRRYLSGEERALVRAIGGWPAIPALGPRPFERGVSGRPTLVQNVETLAHFAQIVAFGGDWFREVGADDEPGSRLVTVSGAVDRPGVFEVAGGTPVANVLRAAGGRREDVAAVLVGGYFGAWIDVEHALPVRLSDPDLAAHGTAFGAGVIWFLPREACGLRETERVAAWFAGQTGEQCGPCVYGLASIAGGLGSLLRGGGSEDAARLRRWSNEVEGRGACRLPDGAVRFVRSGLKVFAPDIERHRIDGRCDAGPDQALLPLY
jgi:NADH:ubiquinone oxidoreductase subunit F (NADH-binding)